MLKLTDIWWQMNRWGMIKGFLRGIVLTDQNNDRNRLKTLNLQDFDFDSEILNDHLLDAAWTSGKLRLDQEGSDAASN